VESVNISPLDRAVEVIRQREQREQSKIRQTAAVKFNPQIFTAYKNAQQSTAQTPYSRFSEKTNYNNPTEYQFDSDLGSFDQFLSRLNSLGIKTENIKPGLFLDMLV
jgi:hypothetical protein